MKIRLALYKEKLKLRRRLERMLGGSCNVLLYHRVVRQAYDPQQLCVSPEIFRRQLQWLKNEYRVLTVKEFDECLRLGKFPRRSALITFDDGYADNLHEALPILEELNLQALV